MNKVSIQPIAKMKSDFASKFGIPRQSGLVEQLRSTVIFEPEYRNPDALRGIEEFSHLWLIWQFSENVRSHWSPTVRPPRLGGNMRLGVFATRSPFRPNNLGLSCVELLSVEHTQDSGAVLHVAGADLLDGTPIFDIKPYIPYSDCKPSASGGFTDAVPRETLHVDIPSQIMNILPADKQAAAVGVLAQDPRPSYQADPSRIYGLPFAGFDIRFRVEGNTLHVVDIIKL